ncbi:UNVERIFIED_CONTAM: hypothetical protein FKN15_023938 [Acipenser sinensis]
MKNLYHSHSEDNGVSKVTLTSPLEFGDLSKFDELRNLPNKRLIPTHLNYEMIPVQFKTKKCKMIYVIRNPKDTAVSLYHYYKQNPNLPKIEKWSTFLEMFLKGDVVCGSWIDHVLSWEKSKTDENVLVLYYESLKEDLPKYVKEISTFLGINVTEEQVKDISKKSSFSEMKEKAEKEKVNPNHTVCVLTSNKKLIFRKGPKKRVRWLPARRNFSQPCPSLRIPNRFLREGNRPPPARSGHRCVADNANLYVFGGYNPDFDESGGSENEDYPLFRELWRYRFATGTWQQMRTEGYMPRELASMSAVLHGNNLLVFGGTGIPFGESNGNDVHVCNVKYKRWSLLSCRGKKPNRIYGQAMAIINGYLYVFGGTTGYIYSTDLHRLDLNTREWIHLKPNNPPDDLPEERYRHEITHDGQKIYILGGGTSWTSYPLDKDFLQQGDVTAVYR